MAHVPGLDVYAPSTAADAAGLLNAALRSRRPAYFIYPKNLLNDRSVMTTTDVDAHFVPIGKARTVRDGADLTLVCWGSTVPLAERVAEALLGEELFIEVIDLRTIMPWDREAVIASAEKTGRLLVIHEDNHTCGMGGEILAEVAEVASKKIRMARVTRPDTHVPFHFGAQLDILPSFKSVLEKACQLLDVEVKWDKPFDDVAGEITVKARGSSPSDETINIMDLHVHEGDVVEEGTLLASVEADKAATEIQAPAKGVVKKIYLEVGDSVSVGEPLLTLVTNETAEARPVTVDDPGVPLFEKKWLAPVSRNSVTEAATEKVTTYLSSITSTLGSKVVSNSDLNPEQYGWSSEDVQKRTGIASRPWLGEDETVLTLAVKACRTLLDQEGLDIADVDALICSTGTPISMTPSLACRVLYELAEGRKDVELQAHDVNAACSGYLYALQSAHDLLQMKGGGKVLVVTAEALSQCLNQDDPDTIFLFGDAATATLVSSTLRESNVNLKLNRPELSAMGEEEKVLYVPCTGQPGEYLEMQGQQVFRVAVKKMIHMLNRACGSVGVTVQDLDMIVPHQANERIIEAIRKSIKFPTEKVFYHIRELGNTSSNTIPLSMEIAIQNLEPGAKVGLCAFGGGYTFGAAVLETV